MTSTKRLFLSFDLAISVVEALVDVQQELGEALERDDGVRWIDPQDIRLTLKYLGEAHEALVPLICEQIHELVRNTPIPPFQVSARSVGMYPEDGDEAPRPRLLWVGLDPKSDEVIRLLQLVVERELEKLGLAPEVRPFYPRLMLGRIRSAQAAQTLVEPVTALAEADFGRCYVKDFVLFEARRTHRGPQYDVIERFALGAM